MNWLTQTLTRSIGQKLLMALTGLFLILFITVHLAGNLQLLLGDEGKTFNIYAHKMATNPFIKIISYGNFFFILLHVVYSILLTKKNKSARKIGYKINTKDSKSTWASKNMGVLGFILFIFILVHLKGFWYEAKYGVIESANYNGELYKNLYLTVLNAYSNIWYVLFYVICMGFLAFHLSHGFSSAFQTLGFNHKKYTPFVNIVGKIFSIIIPALFALIPIWMYLKIFFQHE